MHASNSQKLWQDKDLLDAASKLRYLRARAFAVNPFPSTALSILHAASPLPNGDVTSAVELRWWERKNEKKLDANVTAPFPTAGKDDLSGLHVA